jgi:hypothetical protein
MMTITVNGKSFSDGFNPDGSPKALQGKPRLKWSDIGRLAGIPMGPRGKWTNNGTVRVTAPGEEKPRVHKYGYSLVLVDGMSITARP